MEQGTLSELYLTRSVTKHIRKHNKTAVVGAGVGKDYSLVKMGENAVLLSEGMAETPSIAWVKALNNAAVAYGLVAGVRVCYMLPENVEESQLKLYAGEFNSLADAYGIQIIGGNTRVSSAYARPSFLVEVMGRVNVADALPLKAKPGYQIVMAGYTGILGTNLILDERSEELRQRFAASYVEGCRYPKEDYCIMAMVDGLRSCRAEAEITYMHDVSHGGVYGALWQLGVALNTGVLANHRCIPIKQETVEVCNYFDINPYMLEGTGALLIVAKDGRLVVDSLNMAGFTASVVGELTENKERVVLLGSGQDNTCVSVEAPDTDKSSIDNVKTNNIEKRFLAPVKGDEIYKVIVAY